MNLDKLVGEVEAQLDRLSDPQRLEKAESYYPTDMVVKGVAVPDIRPIVKELGRRLGSSPPDEVIRFAKQLVSTRILEARQIACEVLGRNKAALSSLTLEDLLELGAGMDNWVSVDNYSVLLAGPAWREGQIEDEAVKKWATSDDRWWRRTAVVSTVALNLKSRGGTGDMPRTLGICQLVAADQDEMVAKGLSWALRELSKRDAAPVAEFIVRNESVLPKRVIREVRRKLETGRKYG
jgi:3-methyladenine DNA glycosylase AlkD